MGDVASESKSSLWRQIFVTAILALIGGAVGLLFTYHKEIYAWAFPARPTVVEAVPLAEALEAIAADLERVPTEERSRYRYLVLAHLQHPAVSEEERTRAREAVREAVAWAAPPGQMSALEPLGRHNTVLRLALPDLRWEATEQWQAILEQYPYGLDYRDGSDVRLAAAEQRIRKILADQPYLRGDWFAARLGQPPLAGKEGKLQATREVPATLQKFARDYVEQAIDLERVGRELPVANVQTVRAKIQEEQRLQDKQGLAPLLSGGTLTRSAWESRRFGTSPYQDLARELKLGIPETH